jgi:hypothetical protein
MRPIYDMSRLQPASLPGSELLPTTFQLHPHSHPYAYIDHSANTIPSPQTPTIQTASTFHRHIKRLVGRGHHLKEIASAIKSSSLIITIDGSFDPITTQASYSWVLEANGNTIHSGSSQITSCNRNAYRAELLGQLAALHLISWVEELYPGTQGTVTLVSDCKKAIR